MDALSSLITKHKRADKSNNCDRFELIFDYIKIRTNTNNVKSGGSGRIEASSAKEVTDEGKNDNENENESGSDEERGPNNAINTKSGGKNSSYSTQSGSTEDPRKG
ncbi:hypothetical protein CsatA_010077 [Cannabis sativa]